MEVPVGEDFERRERVRVRERLTHPHERDAVDRREVEHLVADLVGVEVADQSDGAGGAERATEAAADLRRDAQRGPVGAVLREDGLDAGTLPALEEHLLDLRAALASHPFQGGQRRTELGRELAAQAGGQLAEIGEVPDTAVVHAAEKLPQAVGRLPGMDEKLLEAGVPSPGRRIRIHVHIHIGRAP